MAYMKNPPTLTDEARREALAKATLVRKERAAIRVKLAKRELTFSELLDRVDDDSVGKMKVLAVIESMPGIGKVRARKLMDEIGIYENRRLRGLGVRQRAELLEAFKQS